MRLDSSVPKKNSAECGGYGGGGLSFSCVRESAARFLHVHAGKALVLAEDTSFSALLPAVRSPRALAVLWEGDALPLFALPEAGCLLAAGGAELLKAARFFSAVRGVPCMLFPTDASLDGALCARGDVTVDANRIRAPLAAGETVCDMALLRPSCGEGYARLMLARLALFEAKAVGLIARRPWGGAAYEEAYALTEMRDALSAEEIVRRNGRLRLLEDTGLPRGEGAALAGSGYARWRALTALYLAFFSRGVPRRYCVPDYAARAKAAGVPYAALCIPSREEYAARALRLERVRGELLAELRAIFVRRAGYERALRTLGAGALQPPAPAILKTLPEHAEGGLSALIRDFGLMEM